MQCPYRLFSIHLFVFVLCHTQPPQAMRTIYDEYNDEEITLSKEELRMIMAIRKGQFPSVEVNPYEPYVDW